MAILCYIVIGVSTVGLILGFFKSRSGAEWARKVITVSLIAGALSGAYLLYHLLFGSRVAAKRIEEGAHDYAKASTLKLGRYLAEKFPGSKALVILPLREPYGPTGFGNPRRHEALLDGLREGFGDAITLVASEEPLFPEIVTRAWAPPKGYPEGLIDEDLLPDLEVWFDATYLEQYLRLHEGQYDLAVSLAGLPHNYRLLSVWRRNPRLKFALWFPDSYAEAYRHREIIAKGDVDAAVTRRPEFDPRQRGAGDPDTPYVDRFVVLTPENAMKVTDSFPPPRR